MTDNVHDVSGGTSLTWYLKDAIALYLDVPDDGDGGEWILGDHAFAFVADPSGAQDGRWWRRGEAEGSEESPAPPETRIGGRPQRLRIPYRGGGSDGAADGTHP